MKFLLDIPKDTHTKIKVAAALKDKSMNEFILEAVEDKINKEADNNE